jgi:membrane protein required for colicin V production
MNALDIGVIAIVVLSGLFAFARGFVREVLSILVWFSASYAALYAYPNLRPYTTKVLPPGPVADAVGGIAVFLVVLIVLSIIASIIARGVKRTGLSALDRSLGLLFGLGRGVLLVCIGYIALFWILPPGGDMPHWIAEARTQPILKQGADLLQRMVPANMRERAASLKPGNSLQHEVEEAIRAYAKPGAKAGAAGPSGYTQGDQSDMNRLIMQQLGSNPDMQNEINRILQAHGINPAAHPELQRMMQQQGMSPQVQQEMQRLQQAGR